MLQLDMFTAGEFCDSARPKGLQLAIKSSNPECCCTAVMSVLDELVSKVIDWPSSSLFNTMLYG